MTTEGRVLVVDPEPLVAELVTRRLNEAGFEAFSTGNGEEAMRIALGGELDVVLVATRLPDCSGLELVERLRSEPRTHGISIAVLTVLRDPVQTLRLIDAGADDCLRKPIDRVELVGRVRSLARIKRQLDELRSANERLAELNRQLDRTASIDALTQLGNRRTFDARMAIEVERAERYGQPLSLLVLDVDHFKRVNDTYGHAAGDDVLRALGAVIQGSVRRVDLAARYGGEEIAVIAPATSGPAARSLAERLRRAVADVRVTVETDAGPTVLAVTTSVGVATRSEGQTAEDLFAATDSALYRAKQRGRDRVEFQASAPSTAPMPATAFDPAQRRQ